MKGAFFENLIINEFDTCNFHRDENRRPYFWLSNHGKEIDCRLVDGATITSVEIKSGKIRLTNYFDNSAPKAYGSTKVWPLSTGDGTKTVYAKFMDTAGNWSIAYSDTILLDATSPTTTASPPEGPYGSPQSVTLTCGDGAGSGCDKIYYTTDGTIPTTASPVYSAPINISVTTPLKFFAKDLSGNSETVKTENYNMDPIVINSGAAFTNTTSVTLTLTCPMGGGCT